MSILSEARLEKAAGSDLETLVFFDEHGLFLGPEETPAAFAARLRTLRQNLEEFHQELDGKGYIDFFGARLVKKDAIPKRTFDLVQTETRQLYRFAIDWVPGFYTNYRMGLLFAGCAYYSFDDFFAVFIIRQAFQKREKWFLYGRSELMSHELCHIAHIAHDSRKFEEVFAYQTSPSFFRRAVGGLLRSTTDTYLLLGSVLLLLAAQVTNVTVRPMERWQDFPMPQLFGLCGVVLLFIIGRYLLCLRQFRRARARLAECFGEDVASAVLFRCSDTEIVKLSQLSSASGRSWVEDLVSRELRWKIIQHRFPFKKEGKKT